MKGAIFFTSKYGSTKEYALWISEGTGLPMFDIKRDHKNPSEFDFLIIGSPIIYFKLTIRSWVKKHLARIQDKPIIFFFRFQVLRRERNSMDGLQTAYQNLLFPACIMSRYVAGKFLKNLHFLIG